MKLSKKLTTVTPASKFLALVLFILLPFFGFSLGMQYQKAISWEAQELFQKNSQQALSDKNQSNANWSTYKNSTWGFELQLPPEWKGYLVSELDHRQNKNPRSEYTADVCLYFERADSIPACILQISIYTSKQWETYLQKTEKPIRPLAQFRDYVFVSNEYSPQCVQLDEFQCNRSKELAPILSTFKASKE